MGRMVSPGAINSEFNQDHISQGLIRSAAKRVSNNPDEFEQNLTQLLVIMPFLQARLARIKPELLAGLASDVETTASRILSLKVDLIPGADVESILHQRPSLLLNPEWSKIGACLSGLQTHYSDKDIAAMVSKEPLLLVEDVEKILRELERFVPAPIDLSAALRANPELASQVIGLRDLSLW